MTSERFDGVDDGLSPIERAVRVMATTGALRHGLEPDLRSLVITATDLTAPDAETIQKELDAIGKCPTGDAVVTQAGALKAEYIIHTNGPKFREEDEEGKLRRATKSALLRADEKGIKRLALPPIGTGLYQVPLDLCVRVMVDTVKQHLHNETSLEEVIFVAPDAREYGPFKQQIEGGA